MLLLLFDYVDFEEGSRAKLTFTRFALESSDGCSKDYVAVHNGGSPGSPEIWRGCGSSPPPANPVVGMSNRLWVHFHSDATGSARGFAFVAQEETLGCGGIMHGSQGTYGHGS